MWLCVHADELDERMRVRTACAREPAQGLPARSSSLEGNCGKGQMVSSDLLFIIPAKAYSV